jgi:hypothetical protein
VTATLPQAASEVSPAWLSEALGDRITAVRAEPLIAVEGVNSEVTRLHLEAAEGGDTPRTMVLKVRAASEAARGVAAFQRWYEREVGFYEAFAANAPVTTPTVYFACIQADGRYVLLLEDIATPQGDQIAGCGIDAAREVVVAAARLHARFWQSPRLQGHDWLPDTTVGLDRAGPVQGAFARGWARRRDSASSALRPLIDAAVEAYPDLLSAAAAPPVTLIHGDYRLDNMFLDGAGAGLVVIDWQFIARCRGVYDVAYFVGLSLEPEVRREHEKALLAEYREQLAAAGVSYASEAIEQDYRLGLLLSYAVFCIGAVGHDPETRAGRMHEVGLRRLGAAIVDHGADGVL